MRGEASPDPSLATERLHVEGFELAERLLEAAAELGRGVRRAVCDAVPEERVRLPDAEADRVDRDALRERVRGPVFEPPAGGLAVGDDHEPEVAIAELLVALRGKPVDPRDDRLREWRTTGGIDGVHRLQELLAVAGPEGDHLALAAAIEDVQPDAIVGRHLAQELADRPARSGELGRIRALRRATALRGGVLAHRARPVEDEVEVAREVCALGPR